MKFFSKNFLWILLIIIALHLITIMNKGYYLNDRYLSSEQYQLFMDKVPPSYKRRAIFDAEVTYFRNFTESSLNVFYSSYFILLVGFIAVIKTSGLKELEDPIRLTRDQAIQMSKDLLAEAIIMNKKS